MTSSARQAAHARGLHGWRGFAFTVPYLFFLVLFGIFPMLYALKLAFTKTSGGFAGFRNFTDTATDYRFVPAMVHVLIYTTVWLTLLMVFVVMLARPWSSSASITTKTISRVSQTVVYTRTCCMADTNR